MSPATNVIDSSPEDEGAIQEELRRLREGRDEAAFLRIYERYSARLYRVALLILKSDAEAEETLQDAFMQLWERGEHYDPSRGRLYTWLCLVTRSKAIDRLRRRRRQEKKVALSPEGDPEAEATPRKALTEDALETLLAAEGQERALGLLQRLPQAQAQVLSYAFFEGLSQREIALKCAKPLGTVKTQMRSGLKKLAGLAEAEKDLWP